MWSQVAKVDAAVRFDLGQQNQEPRMQVGELARRKNLNRGSAHGDDLLDEGTVPAEDGPVKTEPPWQRTWAETSLFQTAPITHAIKRRILLGAKPDEGTQKCPPRQAMAKLIAPAVPMRGQRTAGAWEACLRTGNAFSLHNDRFLGEIKLMPMGCRRSGGGRDVGGSRSRRHGDVAADCYRLGRKLPGGIRTR
jgi:hypothetical protein